jgi:hypothetical protein
VGWAELAPQLRMWSSLCWTRRSLGALPWHMLMLRFRWYFPSIQFGHLSMTTPPQKMIVSICCSLYSRCCSLESPIDWLTYLSGSPDDLSCHYLLRQEVANKVASHRQALVVAQVRTTYVIHSALPKRAFTRIDWRIELGPSGELIRQEIRGDVTPEA